MNVVVSPLLRGVRRLLVLAAVFSGSAQAATYHGVWDPPFGSPFGTLTTGLGWRGSAEYFVPDTCEPSGNAFVINALPVPWGGCGGAAAVTSASVELYGVADSLQTTLATLTFNPSSFYVGLLQYVGGELEGLLTDFSNSVAPTESLAMLATFGVGVTSTTEFSLIFTLDGPRLAWRDCGYTESYSTSSHHTDCSGGINSNLPGFQPEFTITRVPEPGTLALACLGLLAVVPRRVRAVLARGR